jgi:alpha-beta hydrolase superfamily lysophospholipase
VGGSGSSSSSGGSSSLGGSGSSAAAAAEAGAEVGVTSTQPGVGDGSGAGQLGAPRRAFRLLLVHGGGDTLAYPSAPARLLATLAERPGQEADAAPEVKVYAGLFHELLHEAPADRQQVATDVAAFFDASLPVAASETEHSTVVIEA